MHPLLRLVRVGNAGVSFIGTIVGGFAAAGAGLGIPRLSVLVLLLAAASTTCVTAAGNVLNDLGDRETDRRNHPDRSLVVGTVSVATARRLVYGLFAASVLLVLPVVTIAWELLPILASALLAVLVYERGAKARGLSGNLLVAYLTGAVFLYGGAAVNEVLVVLPLALMAVLATLSREVIKDMEDAEGDVDRSTLPRTHGMATSTAVARGAVAAAILLTPIPILLGLAGRGLVEVAYAAVVVVADGLFVASVFRLPASLHAGQSLSKRAMTVALLAFLATAFR